MSDDTAPQPLGGNQAKDFQDRLEAFEGVLDKIETLKGEAKLIKEAAKSEGYDMQAFATVEKLKRKGFAQITFQMVLTTYLKAAGLPSTLEEARRAAEAEAGSEPESKTAKKEKRRRGRMN